MIKLITRKDFRLPHKSRQDQLDTFDRLGVVFSEVLPKGAMVVTHCSGPKSGAKRAVPSGLYASPRCNRFYSACRLKNMPYGILSDKYGLHMYDVSLPTYNIGPSDLSNEQLQQMGARIKAVCKERNIKRLHYIATPPSVMVPYLIMLFASGIPFTISHRFPTTGATK